MSLELVIKELTAAINTLADAYGLQRVENVDPEEYMDGPNAPDGNGPAVTVIKHEDVPGALRRRGRPAGSKNKDKRHKEFVTAAVFGAEAAATNVATAAATAEPGTEAVFAPFPSAPDEPEAPPPPAPVPPVPEEKAEEKGKPVAPAPADAPPMPIAVSFTKEPVTHDTIRIEARHLVARGDTPVLQKWLKDNFDVEAVSMIPDERLVEALESIRKLV